MFQSKNVWHDVVLWFLTWIDPWYWITTTLFLFVIALVGVNPILVEKDATAGEIFKIRCRQLLVYAFVVVSIIMPICIWAGAYYMIGPGGQRYSQYIASELLHVLTLYWTAPIAFMIIGYITSILYHRYIVPNTSAFFKRWRVHQTADSLSDIRAEQGRLKPKMFLPSQYYKNDKFFMGLNEKNKPIYIDDNVWIKQNQKSIGPTQTGKGVHIGVQVDQAIRKNMCVFVIDPKPDAHLPHIMKQACEETGRPFVSLDLNHGANGKWSPFIGGSQRDIRSRIIYAFGLQDMGDQADFYKAAEREILDKIMPTWDGQLETLRKELITPKYKNESGRMRSYVNEWLSIDTFSPRKGRGFSVGRSLENNAVVYIRASLDDQTVIKAATVMIMEIVQELKTLYAQSKRETHLFFAIDEVRFMISDMLADALATVVGFDANLLIAYQSIKDLRSLKDQSLDAESIEESVNVNCKLTLCYMAIDTETAEWAAELSGIVQKSVSQFEQVSIKKYGAEVWGKQRMLSQQEEHYITANVMRMLPERVGILFLPNQLAQILYTCWIPVLEPIQDPVKVIAPPAANAEQPTLEEAVKKAEPAKQEEPSKQAPTQKVGEQPQKSDKPVRKPQQAHDQASNDHRSKYADQQPNPQKSKEAKQNPRTESRPKPAGNKQATEQQPRRIKEQRPSHKDNRPNRPQSSDRTQQQQHSKGAPHKQQPATKQTETNKPPKKRLKIRAGDNSLFKKPQNQHKPNNPKQK